MVVGKISLFGKGAIEVGTSMVWLEFIMSDLESPTPGGPCFPKTIRIIRGCLVVLEANGTLTFQVRFIFHLTPEGFQPFRVFAC
jgi:hypothetical protein